MHGKDKYMFKKGMIRFRRKLATLLTVAMVFSNYPLPAYATGETADEVEVMTEVSEENETVSEDPGQNNDHQKSLLFSEISNDDLTGSEDERHLNKTSLVINGFTIHDTGTSNDEKLVICKNNASQDICISSVSVTTGTYLSFGEESSSEKTYISFETDITSEVAIVGRINDHYYYTHDGFNDYDRVYLKKEDGEELVKSVEYTADHNKKTQVILFNDIAAGTYNIYAGCGVEIYYIMVMPKSTNKTWDFTTANTFGMLTDSIIEGTIGYIDGMIVDARHSKSEYVNNGTLFLEDTILYIPVYENSVIKINTQNVISVEISVNDRSVFIEDETEFECISYYRLPGYVQIKA